MNFDGSCDKRRSGKKLPTFIFLSKVYHIKSVNIQHSFICERNRVKQQEKEEDSHLVFDALRENMSSTTSDWMSRALFLFHRPLDIVHFFFVILSLRRSKCQEGKTGQSCHVTDCHFCFLLHLLIWCPVSHCSHGESLSFRMWVSLSHCVEVGLLVCLSFSLLIHLNLTLLHTSWGSWL